MNHVTRRALFGIVFLALGTVLLMESFKHQNFAMQILLGWISLNFTVVGFAFVVNWRSVFGKDASGLLGDVNRLTLMPFLLFVDGVRAFQNACWPTPVSSQILPGFYVGRICEFTNLPDDITVVVDLTAEFGTPSSLRSALRVVCLPTLDSGTPDWDQCERALETIDFPHESVYVCCANGYGRSVTFAAVFLGYNGYCLTPEEAMRQIKTVRPPASPNADQMKFIHSAYHQFANSGLQDG